MYANNDHPAISQSATADEEYFPSSRDSCERERPDDLFDYTDNDGYLSTREDDL
jgi:hypothetical protein